MIVSVKEQPANESFIDVAKVASFAPMADACRMLDSQSCEIPYRVISHEQGGNNIRLTSAITVTCYQSQVGRRQKQKGLRATFAVDDAAAQKALNDSKGVKPCCSLLVFAPGVCEKSCVRFMHIHLSCIDFMHIYLSCTSAGSSL
jgi:hypothetical protein